MQHHDREELMKLAEQIERYLESHPDAADSLEGIANWWLPRQRYIESIEQVNEALDILVRNGRVEKTTLSDGHVIYVRKSQINDG